MDKQKAIENMAKLCCFPCEMCESITLKCIEGKESSKCAIAMQAAKNLVSAGYGNIEQALTEFAERLKENLETYYGFAGQDLEDMTLDGTDVQEAIDETLKEFLKQ